MVGLTVCSVMTATLTTALSSAAGRDEELVGAKVVIGNLALGVPQSTYELYRI